MMNQTEQLVRENIRNLKPYSSARDECFVEGGILLDANENPFGNYNRYPDPQQRKLKQLLAAIKNVAPENIFLGNGSDEAIDIAVRIFCEPGKHKILSFPPTFGVVAVAAALNNVVNVLLPATEDFQINMELLPPLLKDADTHIVYLCSPNNPTGNLLHEKDILYMLDHFQGIVMIDEAYLDFSGRTSYTKLLHRYPRLVILQTFSKAWGMAGVRIGMAIAAPEIIRYFNNVKMPYNISEANQQIALERLASADVFEKNTLTILEEKEKLKTALGQCAVVKKIYPSDANFFLVEVSDATWVYEQLAREKLIVRNQHRAVKNCLRITVGTPAENTALITALNKLST
jgi:histidinol-phosphate aminotransferase